MRKKIRLSLAALGVILLVYVAYEGLQGGRRVGVSLAEGERTSAWREHNDPMGFAVSIPPGWAARADRRSGRVEIQDSRSAGSKVVVWPVFIPAGAGVTPSGRARGAGLEPSVASAIARKLVTAAFPGTAWEPSEAVGTTALRCRGRAADVSTVAVFTWVRSRRGSAGILYAAAAPSSQYRGLEPTLARILQSFRLRGTAAPGSSPALAYVRWSDPRENAFSLDVPSQWRVSGGLFRFASVDTRSAVEAVSPEDQIRIVLGDAEVPPFTEPSPTLAMAGFREGGWYSPGYGVQMLVRRYVSGREFALEQVRRGMAAGCAELALAETRDRPDLVEAINAVYARYGQLGFVVRLTAGETAFTCRRGNQLLRGYYFAATQLTQGQGVSLWSVPYMGGFLSAVDKAAQAQAAFGHMVQSVELSPRWAAMQSHLAGETSRIVSQTHQQISSLIDDTYWRRQGMMDELDRRRSNVILGVEDVVDVETGRQFKVESGSNYYWIDHRGTVVGTETDTRPNLDFRQLMQLP